MEGAARQAAIDRLANFPRVRLGNLPTPIEEMSRLRAAIGPGCPRLFIKRDDYTGFGFGGNKVRTLEYVCGRLKADDVKAVVTMGGDRSNHVRVTAFACARLGIRCVLVVDEKPRPGAARGLVTASQYYAELVGAEIHVVRSIEERTAKAEELVEQISEGGMSVRLVPLGGATTEGAIGFVAAMREIEMQQRELGLRFDRVYFASSGAGTHTGMLVGAHLYGLAQMRFTGIAPEPEGSQIQSGIRRFIAETESLLYLPSGEYDLDVDEGYAGAGYCEETAEASAAIGLVARTEGILLDPVYSGKAMAGLIDRVEKGRIGPDENVLFWHTGGQHTMFYTVRNYC